jgi:S1 RNA binding domain protein
MACEVNEIYDGKVVKVTEFGAFIELASGDTGLCHISEIDHSYVKDVRDFLHEADTVKVKVLSIKGDGKIDLSIKAASEPQFTAPPRRTQKDPQFEKMMKKFLRQAEENLVDLKRHREAHLGG